MAYATPDVVILQQLRNGAFHRRVLPWLQR
jgi:hypothetical protein